MRDVEFGAGPLSSCRLPSILFAGSQRQYIMSRKIKKRSTQQRNTKPFQLEATFQEAFGRHQHGHLEEAKRLYQAILAQVPGHPQALNLLGLIAQAQGEYQLAVHLAQKATAITPNPEFLSNLGSAFRGFGNLQKAISSYKSALDDNPSLLEAQFNLAGTLLESGESAEAERWFRKVISRQPSLVAAIEGISHACNTQGKYEEGLEYARKLIQLTPGHATGYLQKGMALQGLKRLDEARQAYEKACELDQNQAVALNNIGNILSQQGDLHQALSLYQRAVALQPDFIEASINLAWAYAQHGMLSEAAACYRQILTIRPDQCHIYSDFLFTSNYDPAISPQQHLDAARAWWEYYRNSPASCPQRAVSSNEIQRLQQKKLTIGFLSPNFCHHPVGIFFLPLIQELAQQDISVFCYAEMTEDTYDQQSDRIKAHAHKWFSTWNVSCAEVASQIKKDGVDILIDLAGHSAFNRLDVMAAKPAALQAEWLGYVNTTGLPTIDYRLTDDIVDPHGADQYYSETLIRLPHGFFCYPPPANAPEVKEAPILSTGTPTFGSLNNLAKINPNVIGIWADILSKTPGSRLIMVSRALADEFIRQSYTDLFATHGIGARRLEMIPNLPMQEYLALYDRIDVALDPFPHNGHTISCHTLWMGVPVVVLRGDRYAGRMGASIMTRIGLGELVAETQQQYVEIAVQLASSPQTVAQLRMGMRARMLASPICDHGRFAADFMEALQSMVTMAQNHPHKTKGIE